MKTSTAQVLRTRATGRLPIAVLLCLFLTLGGPFSRPAEAQAPSPKQTFESWLLSCEDGRPPCYISQSIQLKETGQRILRVVTGHLGPEGRPILHLTVPLGIYLPLGVALRVDEGPQRKAEVQTCTADGCEATLLLDTELLTALTEGKLTQVAFLDAVTRRQITVAVPMAGFRQAYTALQQQAASR